MLFLLNQCLAPQVSGDWLYIPGRDIRFGRHLISTLKQVSCQKTWPDIQKPNPLSLYLTHNRHPDILLPHHNRSQTALIPAAFATWCVITASILAEKWGKKAQNSAK